MTDKQIIIDGVDVSGCNCLGVKLTKKHMCICDSIDFCNEEPNCYYKQLKRKEQECNKLKQTLAEIKEIAKKHKATAHCDYLTDMDKILQKISKVENDR